MKKILLQLAILLFPILLFAQKNEPALFEDFGKKIRSINSVTKISYKVWLYQINADNDTFNMIAMDDQMRVLWNTSLEGYAMSAGKFKDKIIAVATTDRSSITGHNNVYKAFMLDPQTGKVLNEKVVYEGDKQYMEVPAFYFTNKGDYFKMVVRQTSMERRLHVGMPGALAIFSLNKADNQEHEVRDLTAVDFNEKLEVISTTKPKIDPESKFVDASYTINGDLVVAWFKSQNSVTVSKYEAGKKEPVSEITQNYNIRENIKAKVSSDHMLMEASSSNNNIVYTGFMYENINKDIQLCVARYDLAKETKLVNDELFTKDHLKELNKTFVKVNKEIGTGGLSKSDHYDVRYMREVNGKLLIAISTRTTQPSQIGGGMWCYESAFLINGYDANMKTLFQQLLPSGYAIPSMWLPTGFYVSNNTLHAIGNLKDGAFTIKAIHGTLDIDAGKWTKMELLSKKKIDNSDHASGNRTLWFDNSYIVPYMSMKGWSGVKFNVTLQQNLY